MSLLVLRLPRLANNSTVLQDTLRDLVVTNNHRLTLRLAPSVDMLEGIDAAEREKLAQHQAKLSADDIQRKETAALAHVTACGVV